MLRVTSLWTGGPMGQGVSVINVVPPTASPLVGDAQAAHDAVRGLWDGARLSMPDTISIAVSSIVEVVRDTDGVLQTEFNVTPGAAQVGAVASAGSAAGVGGRVRWRTDAFRGGRRVIGTTFIVPLAATEYEPNGTLKAAALANLTTGATQVRTALASAGQEIGVWSRPSAVGAADGVLNECTSAFVPDQVAWLTSRRH